MEQESNIYRISPFAMLRDEGLYIHFNSSCKITLLQKSLQQDQKKQNHQTIYCLSKALTLPLDQPKKSRKMNNSLAFNQQVDLEQAQMHNYFLINLIENMVEALVSCCDQNQFTSHQQKIIYTTLKYFILLIEEKQTWIEEYSGQTMISKNKFLKWLQENQALFESYGNKYKLNNSSNKKDRKYLNLISFTEQQQFIQLLNALQAIKVDISKQNKLTSQIEQVLDLTIQLSILHTFYQEKQLQSPEQLINLTIDKQYYDRFKICKQTYQKTKNKQLSNLNQVLLDCCCLMVGQLDSLIGYQKQYSFKNLKLHLEFGHTFYQTKKISPKSLVQSIKCQFELDQTYQYMNCLMINGNYHETYQKSLNLLNQYFSSILGIIAFMGQIPDPSIIRYDTEYRNQIISQLLQSCMQTNINSQVEKMKILLNTVSFYEKYLNPLNLSPEYIQKNMSEQQKLQIATMYSEDPMNQLKKLLFKKLFRIPYCFHTNSDQQQIQDQQIQFLVQFVKYSFKMDLFYMIQQYFLKTISYYLGLEKFTQKTLQLFILELSIQSEQQKLYFHQQPLSSKKFPILLQHQNYQFNNQEFAPNTEKYSSYYQTVSIQALSHGFLVVSTLQNPFDYSLLDIIRSIQHDSESKYFISDPEAIQILKNYFTIYIMLQDIVASLSQPSSDIITGKKQLRIQNYSIPYNFMTGKKQFNRFNTISDLCKKLSQVIHYSMNQSQFEFDAYLQVMRVSVKFIISFQKLISDCDQINIQISYKLKFQSIKLLDILRQYMERLKTTQVIGLDSQIFAHLNYLLF